MPELNGNPKWWKNPPPWLHWATLVLAIISTTFQVTGPLKNEQMNKVPIFIEASLQVFSKYGKYIAVGAACLLIYWMRRYVIKAAVWAGEWLYVRPLVVLIGPVVQRILEAQTLPEPMSPNQEQFIDRFESLENWIHEGSWSIINEDNTRTLIVTNSGTGGIASPCVSWKDYVFEFETKIMQRNSSWIIRAQNLATYVMLQCQPHAIFPHYRLNGQWTVADQVRLQERLPVEVWFKVRIEVKHSDVKVTIVLPDREMKTLTLRNLLKPSLAPMEYAAGSIGFRESSVECSHFRAVSVKKI
jgi:hypothetical protein